MPLTFPGAWRFDPPVRPDGRPLTIWRGADEEFLLLAKRTAAQADAWDVIEHFKRFFAPACGSVSSRSSSSSWAETDLASYMHQAKSNGPVFIEAFFDACEALRTKGLAVPGADKVNAILFEHDIPLRLEPPELKLTSGEQPRIAIEEVPPTLTQKARLALDISLARANQLLTEGRGLEAVREVVWLLESLSTEFRGMEIMGHAVEGTYFNDIATDLRKAGKGTTLAVAVKWAENLQGYLSSPTGGGVRHGRAFDDTDPMSISEAHYFVNLTLSHVGYLLSEHERLSRSVEPRTN